MSRSAFAFELCLLVPLWVFLMYRWNSWRSPLFGLALIGGIEPIGYITQNAHYGPLLVRYHGDDFGLIPNITISCIIAAALLADSSAIRPTAGRQRQLMLLAVWGAVVLFVIAITVRIPQFYEIVQVLTPVLAFLQLKDWHKAPVTTLTNPRVLAVALLIATVYGCGTEVLERFHLIPGTWDQWDIITYVLSATITGGYLAFNVKWLKKRLSKAS